MRFRLRTLLLLMIPIALVSALATALTRARTAANESNCYGSMSNLGFHLYNYRDGHGHYPAAIVTDQDSKPLYSWRIPLYRDALGLGFDRRYNFALPWNSAGNLAAITPTPLVFGCFNNQDVPLRYTNYVAVIDRGVSSLERADAIPRGSPEAARQILVIEYPNSDILWTEPRDFDLADLSRLTPGADPRGLGVVFADARFRRIPLAELRKLLIALQDTPAGTAGIGPPAKTDSPTP